MSCDHIRKKYFTHIAPAVGHSAEELEHFFRSQCQSPESQAAALSAQARTRLLFACIQALGLGLPVHSESGLPRLDLCRGYAAIYDLLKQNGALAPSPLAQMELGMASSPQSPLPPGMTGEAWEFWSDSTNQTRYDLTTGRDADGYDRWGYHAAGFNRSGYDHQGYDAAGYNRKGFNRQGYTRKGYDADGFDAAGFDRHDRDRDGCDRLGYNPQGVDKDGYDRDGYDSAGFDRCGYDRQGRNAQGQLAPFFTPDAAGYYPDGFGADGFDRDGYNADGSDRFGFDRQGYNFFGLDRNGLDRHGLDKNRCDPDGYDQRGYRLDSSGVKRDRLGYDDYGLDADGYSWTGYDANGLDPNGQPRKVKNARGQLFEAKYCKSGWDKGGYDRWGYHKDDGLTAPDEHGQRRNLFGWVYDPDQQDCFDPQDTTRRMPHLPGGTVFQRGGLYSSFDAAAKRWRNVERQGKVVPYHSYRPERQAAASYTAPITPLAAMTPEAYERTTRFDSSMYVPYTERLKPGKPDDLVERWRWHGRALTDDKACRNGVHLRCPHCGRFTDGGAHTCPHFPTAYRIVTYTSGVVVDFHNPKHILATPHNPHYEAGKQPGYRNGRDPDGRDIQGRDGRGFDTDGYTPDGYDLFGRDRDGFDRRGYNNAGVNRHGERRPRDLETVLASLEVGADPLAHKDLADLYGRIASGLVGQPRRVILEEGGGFATDMQGTIRADPYPLGRGADPRHNLVVTRAGIYHELGHELFTPAEVWARVVAVAKSDEVQEGLDAPARRSLPRFLNIVEDGRMERQLCDRYAGTAEVLSASCQLEPRWGETVGEGVAVGEQVFWSLLYTALPFYRIRPPVREAMSAPARMLFEELEPVVQRAVRGDAEEAYRAAVHLARRFQEEGLLDEMPQPEQDYSQPERPGSSASSGQNSSAGSGRSEGSGREHSPAAGRPKDAPGQPDDEKEDRSSQGENGGSGGGAGDEQDGEGMKNSDGSELRHPSERFTGADSAADLKAVLDAVEREASSALDTGLRARLRPDRIGRPLHRPLVSGQPSRAQQYRGLDGLPQTETVETPESNNVELERRLAGRRSAQHKVASDMARTLKAIRQQTEQRLGRQASGKLDRRQLAGAVKGSADIYTRTRPLPETSFAASVAVDLSGSMGGHIYSGELYDAAMTLGDTFEQLDVAYEVRGFGNRSAQFKAIDDPSFEPRRAACLAEMDMGGTRMAATCGLAASALLARPEKNRLFVSLTDGEAGDHDQAIAQVQDARRRGIVCFGIFLGDDPDASKLDQLYGRGNWTSIRQLSDLPRLVGQRMASIFKSLRRQG